MTLSSAIYLHVNEVLLLQTVDRSASNLDVALFFLLYLIITFWYHYLSVLINHF